MSESRVKLTFAGQAGFIIECSCGYKIGIDLYLSNCCERYFGFKRLLPYIYNPLDMDLDLIISTHAHFDHFDPDSVPLMMSNPKTKLLAAYDVKFEAERLGLDANRISYIKSGDVFDNDCVKIEALPCDHGEATPDAVALLIEIAGKKIYIAGDTAYREDYFVSPKLQNTDVFIAPINGAFGNMNEQEAAKAAGIVKSKLFIPCHYWNFAEHGGNPNLFAEAMKENHSELNYLLMRPNETICL